MKKLYLFSLLFLVCASKAISPIASVKLTKTDVGLEWSPSRSYIETYNVYRSEGDSSNWNLIGTTSDTNFSDENMMAGIRYFYGVKAADAENESVFSNIISTALAAPTHDHWCPNGRCLVREGTRKRTYRAVQGQVNIQSPSGKYVPYIWDSKKRIAKFAGGEVRFVGNKVEYWRDEKRIFESSFHPEVKNGSVWNRSIATRDSLFVEEIDTGFNRQLRVNLPFSSANQQDTVTIIVGGGEFANVAIAMRAINAGTYRLNWEIQRVRSGGAIHRQRTSKLDTTRLDVGRLFNDFQVFWHKSEVSDHKLQGSANTEILLKEGSFKEGEVKRLFPETFGPASIAADADDGDERADETVYDATDGIYNGDILYLEDNDATTVAEWNGYRWDNVDLGGVPASIDAGTQIVFTNGADNSGSTNVTAVLSGTNAYDPGQYADSGGNRPSDDTGTTATVALTGQDTDLTVDVETVFEEWVETDGNSYDGAEAVRFFIDATQDAGGSYWSIAEDYDGAGANTETTLTVEYTAAAGAASGPGRLPQIF